MPLVNPIQVIYSGSPTSGLPLQITFQPTAEGTALLFVSGSGWTNTPNQTLELRAYFDNTYVGSIMIYVEKAASHRAFVPVMVPISIPSDGQPHVVSITGNQYTIVDKNDFITVAIIDTPETMPGMVFTTNEPLPQYTKYQSPMTGQQTAFYAGSGYVTNTPSLVTGSMLVLDGNPVSNSQMNFDNNTHLALPPKFAPVQVTYGQHQIGFSMVGPEFQTSGSDFWAMAVF
jgi:hypothetical protein